MEELWYSAFLGSVFASGGESLKFFETKLPGKPAGHPRGISRSYPPQADKGISSKGLWKQERLLYLSIIFTERIGRPGKPPPLPGRFVMLGLRHRDVNWILILTIAYHDLQKN